MNKPGYLKHKKITPRERDVEKYLMWRIAKAGGKAYKWVSPGVRGVPDRMVLIRGYVFFVELKRADEGRIRHHQKVIHKELEGHGFVVNIVYGHRGVDEFMEMIYLKVPGCIYTNKAPSKVPT